MEMLGIGRIFSSGNNIPLVWSTSSVTTLNFHILRVATNVSCSSIMRKYNSYMNIIDNVNFKRLKQLLLWKTQPWSYVFKYEILKFRENKNKYKII